MTPDQPVVSGNAADFNTIVTSNPNGDGGYTNTYTTNGWSTVNAAIQSGGATVINAQTHVIAKSLDKNEKYVVYTDEWTLETPITGEFTIEIVNNSPTAQTGNKDSTFNVYVSDDGEIWNEYQMGIAYVSGYSDVTLELPAGCKFVKIDAPNARVRIKTIMVNFG